MSLTDTTTSTRVATAGVDRAKDDHAVCVLDPDGEPLERLTVVHTKAGMLRLVQVLDRHQVDAVGIERPDGPIIEGLLTAGRTVCVIPPSQVEALRRRYGSAGNNDDRFDAYVLADTVGTDRRRLTPLLLDGQATTVLGKLGRVRKDLVAHRVAVANQLRAPGHGPARRRRPVRRHRLRHQQAVPDPLHHPGRPRPALAQAPGRLAGRRRLQRPGRREQPAPAHRRRPAWRHRRPWSRPGRHHPRLPGHAEHHRRPDPRPGQAGQRRLPRPPGQPDLRPAAQAGTVRAARLLAEIGDARGRFPTAGSLACLAGVAPCARQSGKVTVVAFRWAVDKQLRDAGCDFAGDSRQASPWAARLYQQARARGHDHRHAVRILARAWLDIIWKCWTTNTPYNPDLHRALQRLINQDQPRAA